LPFSISYADRHACLVLVLVGGRGIGFRVASQAVRDGPAGDGHLARQPFQRAAGDCRREPGGGTWLKEGREKGQALLEGRDKYGITRVSGYATPVLLLSCDRWKLRQSLRASDAMRVFFFTSMPADHLDRWRCWRRSNQTWVGSRDTRTPPRKGGDRVTYGVPAPPCTLALATPTGCNDQKIHQTSTIAVLG